MLEAPPSTETAAARTVTVVKAKLAMKAYLNFFPSVFFHLPSWLFLAAYGGFFLCHFIDRFTDITVDADRAVGDLINRERFAVVDTGVGRVRILRGHLPERGIRPARKGRRSLYKTLHC